jgi:hypothetical protein
LEGYPEVLAEKDQMLQLSSYKIPNSKHQITNKTQIPIFNVQNVLNFEFWSLGFALRLGSGW